MASNTFGRERWAALAGAILLTIALPIAIDQGYFRYNAYALPGLGGFAVLLYLGFFISSSRAVSSAKGFRYGFCVRHQWLGMTLFIATFGLVGCLFGAAYYFALGKSKEHVTEIRKRENPIRQEETSQVKTEFSSVPPKNPETSGATDTGEEKPQHRAPRGAIGKGEKIEPFAFTEEIPNTVTVLLDNGSGIHFEANLRSASLQKDKFSGLLDMGGERPLTIYIQDGIFYADASIADGSGHETIQIRKNRFDVKPSTWDRNFSPNAVEIVDSNQRPVFQMIRKRANLIQINGLFVSSKGAIFDARAPKALFKYPAWKYPGKYAEDESPDNNPSLSQLTSAELRLQTQALCIKIRALGKEWDEGWSKNNEKALRDMNAAKSQEEKEVYASQRTAENNHLYRSLEARFNGEYGRNAKALKAELLRRANKPTDVFQQPMVPSLLESGVAAGANPFNEAADYLERLSGQI